MLAVFMVLQVLAALGLIALIAVTTTKSEQGGGGLGGWGTIGGKSSSTIAGLEDQLGRVTLYVAVAFLIFSAMVGILGAKIG